MMPAMKRLAAALALLGLCFAALERGQAEDLNKGSAWQWMQEQSPRSLFQPVAGRPVATSPANPWETIHVPTRSSPESIGFYSSGCLRGAVALGRSGPGWEKMRLSRDRGWGHPRMIAFLRSLAARTSADPKLGTLLIGDMAYARGGPFRHGHKSHQTGLDVDIWYRQVPNGTPVSDAAREQWDSPEMIDYDSTGFYTGFNRLWNPNELAILRLAASDPAVQRIFVSPVIKKLICSEHQGEPWVSKIRAEWGHGDHFHVRLRCEGGRCRPQEPVPSEGCGAELENEWFGEAGRRNWDAEVRRGSKPWEMPANFPAECSQVVVREP